ncbi:hypothetical protein DESA109040_07535 [Deinococcus saxicola]|uniref:hypothetical protein n=1 Tax=Deinococcus saxicola TaxID=249406 RepID=UPI0039EFB0D5
MKRRLPLIVLLSGLALAQQTPRPKQTVTADPTVVLRFLQGDVTMLGATFPNAAFQRGVLNLLKTKKITRLTLLTTKEQLANMVPLRAAGAGVYYLPVDGVRMSGNTIFAGSNTIIVQNDPARWTIMQADRLADQAKASLSLYLNNAKKF